MMIKIKKTHHNRKRQQTAGTISSPHIFSRKLTHKISPTLRKYKSIINHDKYNLHEICYKYIIHPDKSPLTDLSITPEENQTVNDICTTRKIYAFDILREKLDSETFKLLIYPQNEYNHVIDLHKTGAIPITDSDTITRYSEQIATEFAKTYNSSLTGNQISPNLQQIQQVVSNTNPHNLALNIAKNPAKFTIRDMYLPNLLTVYLYLRHLEQKYPGQFAFFRPGINPYGLSHFNYVDLVSLLEKYTCLFFIVDKSKSVGLHIVTEIYNSIINFITRSTSPLRFLAIPVIYKSKTELHLNILIFDVLRREAEIFEPNGSFRSVLNDQEGPSIMLTYKWLDTFCTNLNYRFFAPIDYMGTYGIQMIEANRNKSDKDFRDPEGFCTVWTLVWTEMHILYPDLPRDKLYEMLVDKMLEVNVRTFLRAYADKILEIVLRKSAEIGESVINDIIRVDGDSAKYLSRNGELIYPMILYLSGIPIRKTKIKMQWNNLPTKYLFSMIFKFTELLNFV